MTQYQSHLGISDLLTDNQVLGTTTLEDLNVVTVEAGAITTDSITTNEFIMLAGAVDGYILTTDALGNATWQDPTNTIALTGDVSGPIGANVVDSVGGSSAASVHSGEQLANAATDANTASAIVKRDVTGNFSAGTITANLTGDVSGSASSFTNPLIGDVTGTQGATVVSTINGVDANLTATTNTAQSLINKNITGTTNTVESTSMRNGSTWVIPYSGAAPATNNVLSYNGTNAVWSTPTVSSVTMGGNVNGFSNACIVVGASGHFAVSGITTTDGLTTSSRVNFTTPLTKSITFQDLDSTNLVGQNFDGFGRSAGRVRYQAKDTSTSHIFYAATSSSTSNTLLTIAGNGVVTIPKILNMGNSIQRKMICLYDGGSTTDINGNQFYGFGIAGGTFINQILSTPDYFKWYAGTSPTTSTEAMSLSGTGNLVVPGDVSVGSGVNNSLTVSGIAKARTIHTDVWENPKSQGSWISWNRSIGSGRVGFACQQGGGVGGFEWLNYNISNVLTSPNPLMTLDASGNLTVAGLLAGSFAGDNDVTLSGTWFYDDDNPVEWAGSIRFIRRNGIVSYYIPRTSATLNGAATYQFIFLGGITLPEWVKPVASIKIIAPAYINGVQTSAELTIQSGVEASVYYLPINGATFVGSCQLYETSGSYIGKAL